MRLSDQVVGVVHACKDRNGLNCDIELGSLQVSVILLRELHQEGEHDAVAHIVDPAYDQHAQVPPQLVLVVMVDLFKIEASKVLKKSSFAEKL